MQSNVPEVLVEINSLYTLHTGREGVGFLTQFKDRKINKSDNITIISIFKPDETRKISSFKYKDSILHYQLTQCGVPFINPYEGFYDNSCKIDCYYHALQEVKTEYALLCDGYDVIIMKDLDEGFISKFNSFNVDIMFSRDAAIFPLENVHHIKEQDERHLNSGVIFGKTKELLYFYEQLYSFKQLHYEEEEIKFRRSDQFWIRYFLVETPKDTLPKICLDETMTLCATHRHAQIINNTYIKSCTCVDKEREMIRLERTKR